MGARETRMTARGLEGHRERACTHTTASSWPAHKQHQQWTLHILVVVVVSAALPPPTVDTRAAACSSRREIGGRWPTLDQQTVQKQQQRHPGVGGMLEPPALPP